MANELVDINSINNGFDDIYDNINRINDMSSGMFSGINYVNFGDINNTYAQMNSIQGDVNINVKKGEDELEKMYKKIGKVIGAFINLKNAAKGVSKATDYSENLMDMQNSISSVNDGSQSDTELKEKVYVSSMRSRTNMGSTIATVEGLSGAGFTNDEAIQYTENLNKMFAVAGTSDEVQAASTGALIGSLSDGVVSGEELNSLLNTTPEIVIDMAENMGLSIEQMTSMAEQGQLSADIMKNSMLGATGSINAEFANTKANWSDTMTNIGNMATVAFEPLGNKINEIINSPSFGVFMSNLADGMTTVANVLSGILDVISTVGGFMADNWSIVQPILVGIIALISYIIIVTWGFNNVLKLAKTATTLFNLAWAACPIIMIIIAIIAVFYIVIGVINRLTGSSLSATGIIVGAFSVVWAFIKNLGLSVADIFMELWARIKMVASNIQNAFMFAVNKVKAFFYDMASVVFSLIAKIAEGLNKLPFVSIDVEGLTSKADDYRAKSEAANQAAENNKNSIVTEFTYEKKYDTFQDGWVKDAYNSGYDMGANLFSGSDSEGGFGFGDSMQGILGASSTSDIISGYGTDDYSTLLSGTGVNENTMNNISTSTTNMGSNTYNTAENTFSTTNNSSELVTISKSILEIMQTNMEKENSKPAAQNITVDLSGMSNKFSSAEDGETFVNYLTNELIRKMNSSASGVYI